jgi:hypothetical protein
LDWQGLAEVPTEKEAEPAKVPPRASARQRREKDRGCVLEDFSVSWFGLVKCPKDFGVHGEDFGIEGLGIRHAQQSFAQFLLERFSVNLGFGMVAQPDEEHATLIALQKQVLPFIEQIHENGDI